MNAELLKCLKPVTEEEQRILIGDKQINRGIYTTSSEFTIDSNKMLNKGSLIDIRTHTRFIGFPAHKHNYIEIMYMCTGKTTHIINGNTRVILEKGNLLFLNQFSYHEILPAKMNDIGINFIILPEFFDEVLPMLNKENALSDFLVNTLRQNTKRASYLHYKVADIIPIQNLVENLVWDLLNKQHNHRQIDQTTMGLLFMQLVNQTERIEHDEQNLMYHTVAIKVLKYIEESYKIANLTELANQLNHSVSSLSKMIKSSTGSTFKELLQNKRLNQATHLLTATKLPITDIIYMVGYDNTSYFHRIFKKKYNVSPKQYRDMENKDVKI
ncbi:AraC-like DNA-binding protein [Lachnotalea glycerini]|uniref:AraC family transcriptional regulator n=1 Tax=Lachnotalea glycerini TaxID=1763509 RepID=A0A255IPE1_9FIRM|nr:AraC family transcriptional regulator [Lachnotalea glycerini]PXV85663.1 AraC-like DNA-binding protein [Lachnotalea glycerini]RDY31341.1 AraC family transcriptional regulator [Lachnotalea glycerini]